MAVVLVFGVFSVLSVALIIGMRSLRGIFRPASQGTKEEASVFSPVPRVADEQAVAAVVEAAEVEPAEPIASEKVQPQRRGPGSVEQAKRVLREAGEPLTPAEILDRGRQAGLFQGLTGKSPVTSLAAQLYTATSKRGEFTRPARGKFYLPDDK